MGMLDAPTSQTVVLMQACGHGRRPAGDVPELCSLPSPRARPRPRGAAEAAGGTQAPRLAARPSLCRRGAGGSGGAQRADLGECGVSGGGWVASTFACPPAGETAAAGRGRSAPTALAVPVPVGLHPGLRSERGIRDVPAPGVGWGAGERGK